jgi:glycosyltransferase involved in cell wall biosynthesis
MTNLKILFISHKFYPDIGGIEVNSEVLANEFAKAGCEVRLVTWTEGKGEKDFVFEVVRKPNLFELIIMHRWADVVYENNPSLRLSWPKVLFKTPSVIALRTWISRMDGSISVRDKLKFWWISKARRVIAVSQAVRDATFPDAVVIGNPYRSKLFRIKSEAERPPHFMFLGRLVSDKGVDVAIRAFSMLITDKEIPNTSEMHFTIVGDGTDMDLLKALAKSLSIDDRISFVGISTGESLVDILNAHRFLLVPSVWKEPFGNVALEGMACGCIPFVSDYGGLPDAVGSAGVVFEVNSPDALYHVIKEVILDPSKERQLRMNASSHLSNHTPEIVGGIYLNIIKESIEDQ